MDRRKAERRASAGDHIDVSRREHDNLCRQVDEILRTLQRVEAELLAQSGRIGSLESAVERNRRHAS